MNSVVRHPVHIGKYLPVSHVESVNAKQEPDLVSAQSVLSKLLK